MAEDDLFSAMWRSVVPTADGGGRAGDVEASPVNYWNPREMAVEDMTAYYAEAVQDHHVHVYGDMQPPINDWNGGQMTVHDYAVPVAEEIEISAAQTQTQAPFNSELVYYAADPGVEAIDYDWNEYVMTNGYREAEVVKDIVTVDDQVKKLTKSTDDTRRRGDKQVKIFRVPVRMLTGNKDSYEPQVVSIGPYHCQLQKADNWKRNLHLGEDEKWNSLHEIRCRTWFSATACHDKLKEIKHKVRESYEGGALNVWDRVEMILDACFILYGFRILPSQHMQPMKRDLVLLKRERDKKKRKQDVRILPSEEGLPTETVQSDEWLPFKSVSYPDFARDISLLENQIPFCVLEEVYDLAISKYQEEEKEKLPSLRRQVVKYLHKVLGHYHTAINIDNQKNDDNIPKFEHILDYYHKYFEPSKKNKCTCQETQKPDDGLNKFYSATELYEVGVKLKRIKRGECCPCGKSLSLLDINFTNGTLKIPSLVIDGTMLSLFRNIMAYEQKLNPRDFSKNYFTAYVKFMTSLITTEEDISLLRKKKIIVSYIGDYKMIMDLFGRLRDGRVVKFDDNNYLTSTCFQLDKYYNNPCNERTADIRRKVFGTPRLAIAFLAATVILILTFLSTIAAWLALK